jgi:hypothetical protein
MYEYDSPVGASVFAWGVFDRVFLRIAWVFLRISCRSRYFGKNINILEIVNQGLKFFTD